MDLDKLDELLVKIDEAFSYLAVAERKINKTYDFLTELKSDLQLLLKESETTDDAL